MRKRLAVAAFALFALRAILAAIALTGSAAATRAHAAPARPAVEAAQVIAERSGSRLQTIGATSPEGAFVAHGFYDRELRTTCRPRNVGGAVFRCVPTAAPVVERPLFVDARCEKPVLSGREKGFAVFERAKGCTHAPVVARLGKPAPAEGLFTIDLARRCVPATGERGSDAPDAFRRRLAEIVPLEALVRGRAVDVPGPRARLRAYTIDFDDGARAPGGWRDTEKNFLCRRALTKDGVFRCLPAGPMDEHALRPSFGLFSDAACRDIAVAGRAACPSGGAVPFLAVVTDGCSQAIELFARGPRIADPWVTNDGCRRVSTVRPGALSLAQPGTPGLWRVPDVPVFALGPPIALQSFAPLPLEEVVVGTSGRLRPSARRGPGATLQEGVFFDTELGELCHPHRTTDGVERCLPPANSLMTPAIYTDASRTTRLTSRPACGPRSFGMEVVDVSERPERKRLFQLGDEHVGPILGPTFEAPRGGVAHVGRYLRVGAEQAPGRFVAVQVTKP